MRQTMTAWRTARSTARAQGLRLQDQAVSFDAAAPVAGSAATPVSDRVEWTIPFLALLAYMFAVTTFQLAIATAAMIVALAGLVLRPAPIRLPGFMVAFAAFLVWSLFGYTQSYFPSLTLDAVIELGKVWLVALVAVNALRTRGKVRVFLVFYLGCFALYPVRGTLYNYIVGEMTNGRTAWNFIYQNPNDLAALCLLQLSMAAGLVVTDRSRWVRIAALGGCVLLPLVVLITQSRGAGIALGIFVLLAWLGHRRKLRSFVALVILGAIAASFAPDATWIRLGGLRNIGDTDNLESVDPEGSARQRFEIWKVALHVIGEHPLVGVGVGSYPEAHQRAAQSDRFDPTARGRRDPHSTYLHVAAETGLIGGLLFGALILVAISGARRIYRLAVGTRPREAQQLRFLVLGLVVFFVAGIWGSFAHLSYTYLHLALLWALGDVLRREVAPAEV